MSVADGARPDPGPRADKDELEADIEQTRAALGETASALAAKLDVPQQARRKVDESKQLFAEKTQPIRSRAVPIAIALGGAIVGVIAWRRHRGGQH
ncbi:DUF3618 domain-containing protein [Mycolicibacterium rhodesiae]|uniref:DUF3618 domain-containing protein n=1 Tax=Mycolicibacterium rhodesiae TaxID=36814 RepID=A0A1X0J2X6_MYCRH|nr:DUF3618 domain-containing protein [Mycolicibacterium rhodesiae]MCV7344592.1 DUF3618 domain-containing protein [Mycolicibacterium rhodesiae]ORB56201.1 hypothetical protein BST42_05865 [Mycolicibacterium rhodesiae]